ncbi:MAG: DUF885 family protein [Acidimicrobiales bacterium]
MSERLRAVCELAVASVRENAGLHEYDGVVQDMSPEGVRQGLSRLGGERLADAHDEAHLSAGEEAARLALGKLELHRVNPLLHIDNLDLSCYDRSYAPAPERAAARLRHLAAWPEAVDASLRSLDQVNRPVAAALLPAARGLAEGLRAGGNDTEAAALFAHGRLVAHLDHAAASGPEDASLGEAALAQLLSVREATEVSLADLAARAEAEKGRLQDMLASAVARLAGGREVAEVVGELVRDHPDADGVLEAARRQTDEVIAFTAAHRLVPYPEGQCRVGPAPASRRHAMAMMSWAAPGEEDAPSRYYITPPDSGWPAQDQEEWLSVFSDTTLPAVTAHEVAPGHFSHGRALRHAPTPVRRVLISEAFTEGWAHYAEELCIEEGFHAGDPRFVIGVCIEALVRVTRLVCAIGIHTGEMSVEQATGRFIRDAYLRRRAARSEAERATYDPTYGRYTWGKLEIMALREEARHRWGSGYTNLRFHTALLGLGGPPLGLMGAALQG